MQIQTVDFYIEIQNGVVQNIGRSIILTPKITKKDRELKWYQDKMKEEGKSCVM